MATQIVAHQPATLASYLFCHPYPLMRLLFLALLLTLPVTGITALPLVASAPPDNTADCRDWLAEQQAALARAGIADRAAWPIAGFAHLRGNRWLAFLQQSLQQPSASDSVRSLWLERASDEAWRGLRSELARLYGSQDPDQEDWHGTLRHCIDLLTRYTAFVGVPTLSIADAHQGWPRRLGLHQLSRWLLDADRRAQQATRETFRKPARLTVRHYLPQPFRGNVPHPAALPPNELDLPIPRGPSARALLAHYAPVLSIADPRDVNQPGRVIIDNGVTTVDSRDPVVYNWLSWTYFRGHHLLQLNYRFWFSARPQSSDGVHFSGPLDSVLWRVTLKPDGHVLYYDSVRGDGSSHSVYPVARGLIPQQRGPAAPVYYPELVANAAVQRINLLLEPDSHRIARVSGFNREAETRFYQAVDGDQLRHLPGSDGGVVSIYDERGIVSVSRRSARFFYWATGVDAVGAQRQSTRMPISLDQSRHFDDADLTRWLFR